MSKLVHLPSTFLRAALLAMSFMLMNTATYASDVRTFDTILKSGELRVGVAEFTPWVLASKNGALTGAEVDIARRLGNDTKLKTTFVNMPFEALIPALEKGDIDIIVSGMSITPERALRVNFSQPYNESGVSLVANREKTKAINTFAELDAKGVVIGVVAKTVSADLAGRIFDKATVKLYQNSKDVISDLLKGKVDALVESEPAPTFLSLQYPEKLDLPMSQSLLETREAFAVRKGDPDFLAYLNAWINAREADGVINSIRHYWFESLDWQQDMKP